MINAIERYLDLRRSVGFQLRVQGGLLLGFARFAAAIGEAHVTSATAINWAAMAPTPHQRASRLDTVRIFARHAHAEDQRHEIPPDGVFPRRRPPFLPFIFTPDQFNQVLVAATQLTPHRLIASVDLLLYLFSACGDGPADRGGARIAHRRHHARWTRGPRDEVPQESTRPP